MPAGPPDHALLFGAVLVAYVGTLVGIGAWKARRVHTALDFSLAGRGLSAPVLVGTLLATWIGTGSIFGNAEESYAVGLPALLLPLSGALGIVGLAFLAGRVRRFEGVTVQDLLEHRFGPAARIVGAIALLGGYLIIVSYQYRAGAAVLGRLFPALDPATATALVAALVILYTALAGMVSVAYTDVANGVLMAVGVLVALVWLTAEVGGPAEVIASLPPGARRVGGHWSAAALLSVLLPGFLLLLGDANMYQRFFAARSARAARRSALGMLVGVCLLESAIVALAVVGRALVERGRIPAPAQEGHVIVSLAFDALPPVFGALLVATIVAVIVSTADSYLLAPATSLVRDIGTRFLAPGASEGAQVLGSRLVVVALGLVALALAFTSERFFRVALFAYTVYGATITPALLAAILWRGARPAGAVAGMLTGLGGALLWRFGPVQAMIGEALARSGHGALAEFVLDSDAVLPAALAGTAVLVLVSLATRRTEESTPAPPPATAAHRRADR